MEEMNVRLFLTKSLTETVWVIVLVNIQAARLHVFLALLLVIFKEGALSGILSINVERN